MGTSSPFAFIVLDSLNVYKILSLHFCSLSVQSIASLSFMFVLVILLISLLIGSGLKKAKFTFLHVAGAALLLGIFFGLLIKGIAGESSGANDFLVFKEIFFFLVILPPIIFESGYAMKRRPFFRNLGAISVYAFLGTTLSTFFVGGFLTLCGKLNLAYKLPGLHNMIFGSLISATDPVTTLAIFGDVGANENLFAMVFGESVLNDAVAIVLFRTLTTFVHEDITAGSVFKAFGMFVLIFVGSLVIGAIVGICATITLKRGDFRTAPDDTHNPLEVSLVVIFPYIAYMLADGLLLSGIVAVLFCGIIMGYYTKLNMSEAAETWTYHFFKLMASLAELFVFIYMGLTVFLTPNAFKHLGYFACTLVACLIGRALHIYPGSWCVNQIRIKRGESERIIKPGFMHMLFFSGLRGAVAFALSLGTVEELGDESGQIIISATVFMVVFTVLAFGGTTFTMLKALKLRASDDVPGSGVDGLEKFAHINEKLLNAWVNPTFRKEAEAREAHGHDHGHCHDHDHGHDHGHSHGESAHKSNGKEQTMPVLEMSAIKSDDPAAATEAGPGPASH